MLIVIAGDEHGSYRVQQMPPIQARFKTMVLDSVTHRAYLPTAKFSWVSYPETAIKSGSGHIRGVGHLRAGKCSAVRGLLLRMP